MPGELDPHSTRGSHKGSAPVKAQRLRSSVSSCMLMAKLKAVTRKKLPSSAFGLPASRKYPMEDRVHQIKADEFATKEERKGKLSPAQASRIRAKAKRLLGK